jgi:hypothetical protein
MPPDGRPDAAGVCWRLQTLRESLSRHAHHPIPEMLGFDGFSLRAPYSGRSPAAPDSGRRTLADPEGDSRLGR